MVFAAYTQIKGRITCDVEAAEFVNADQQPCTEVVGSTFELRVDFDGSTPTGIVTSGDESNRIHFGPFPARLQVKWCT